MLPTLVAHCKDPDTGDDSFELDVFTAGARGEVVDGRLVSASSGRWFRIEDSILDLLPLRLRDEARHHSFAARYGLKQESMGEPAGPRDLDNQRKQMDFFKADSTVYDRDVTDARFYRAFDRLYMHDWIAGLGQPQRVLDIGGGTGRQALPLLEANHSVLSCDISEEMLRIAVAKTRAAGKQENIVFVMCDAENLPLAGGSFDSVICYGVMHHMSDPASTLHHASRVLKPGGRWFSVDPHDSALRFVFELAMKARKLYDEVAADDVHFNARQLREMFDAAGLIAEIGYSTYILPHLMNVLPPPAAFALLQATDLLRHVPRLNRLGGIVIVNAVKG